MKNNEIHDANLIFCLNLYSLILFRTGLILYTKNNRMSNFKFHFLLLTKLPIAWIAGLRLKSITPKECSISVELGFLNQNPFQSMFWAVQGMAAELSSGLLCIEKITNSGHNISMLVLSQCATFSKKAKGKIVFTCGQGDEILHTLDELILSREPRTLTLTSSGLDETGVEVSRFEFTWSFKAK